jgi:hypothetical protein
VAERLAAAYERWWQSIEDEGVNERYAYLSVGTVHENPVRITSHDMLTGDHGMTWHQFGAVEAEGGSGIWKVAVESAGEYMISLRRFPRESGLGFNSVFPEGPEERRLEYPMPGSNKKDFEEAYLYIADFKSRKEIKKDSGEISFRLYLQKGRYDMEARLFDAEGRTFPAYYIYIEKLEP